MAEVCFVAALGPTTKFVHGLPEQRALTHNESANRWPRFFLLSGRAAARMRRGSPPNKSARSRFRRAAESPELPPRALRKADRAPDAAPSPRPANDSRHLHPSEALAEPRVASSRPPNASVASRPRTAPTTKTEIAIRGRRRSWFKSFVTHDAADDIGSACSPPEFPCSNGGKSSVCNGKTRSQTKRLLIRG